ncbi:hypothetical protein KAJ83_12590 [Marivibrio halodurans]|uniref:D-alanine--D-alanine ligase n=1 Tax=Marivibrio halodurans TaxID=2039722 RepID=A0A8J7S360_9PROT|nr:hypothetical protein [Marivibrio halodurans]MBP5857849.1 hypothetical protein [Marivibrio halodurans]
MAGKMRIAVLFGGRSPEHDVSVVSGLQALAAVDSARYEAFPVYISTRGDWFVGDALRRRAAYIPGRQAAEGLTPVTLDLTARGEGRLIPLSGGGLFSKPKPVGFDVALPAFHGNIGEDGQIQGLFETAGIPYTGMRTLASALLMDKGLTKRALRGGDIPLLDDAAVDRPAQGLIPDRAAVEVAVQRIGFPAIAKPAHLGSSIGVAKVDDLETLLEVLPDLFRLDSRAVIEPYVPNLVEYNIAVARIDGAVRTSAIERPKRSDDLLDFKQKYMSGGGKSGEKGGAKAPGQASQGMLSLTRDLNPDMPAGMADNIREWAAEAYRIVGGTGAPRIDFLCDGESGQVWLNEVNPCPGSFGYFLWEALDESPMLFTELLTHLIEEAVALSRAGQLPDDPVPVDARLFPRP